MNDKQESWSEDIELYLTETLENDQRWVGDYHAKVYSEYASSIDLALINEGWSLNTAKSYKQYKKVDQSLSSHTRAFVQALIRLNSMAPEVVKADESGLRRLIACGVVHDLHKWFDSEESDEFDVNQEDIEEFAQRVGLFSFAPEVTIDDLQSVAVGLHKNSGFKGGVTSWFLANKDMLRAADAYASISRVSEFEKDSYRKLLRDAYCDEKYTTITHEFTGFSGLVSPILNGAIHDVLVKNESVELFSVFPKGCVYIGHDCGDQSLYSDTSDFTDAVYERFRARLKSAYSRYCNDNVLSGTLPLFKSQNHYGVSDLDVLVLGKEHLIRAIIRAGLKDGHSTFDVSETHQAEIEEISALSGVRISPTRQVCGLARSIHTIYRYIVSELVDSEKLSQSHEQSGILAMLTICGLFEDDAGELESTYSEAVVRAFKSKSWGPNITTGISFPFKYVLAQYLIEKYASSVGITASEEAISTDMLSRLDEQFSLWERFETQKVGDVESEIQDQINATAYINSDSIQHTKQTEGECSCGLCNAKTSAENASWNKLRLVTETPTKTKMDVDGKRLSLPHIANTKPICYACQLDLSLRSDSDSWGEETMYVTPHPDYAYSPLSQAYFEIVLDELSRRSKQSRVSIPELYGDSHTPSWFVSSVEALVESVTTDDLFTKLENAFLVDNAFSTVDVQIPFHDCDGCTDMKYAAASAYSGVLSTLSGQRLEVTSHPNFSQSPTPIKQMLSFSREFTSPIDVLQGEVALDDVSEELRCVSAVTGLFEPLNLSNCAIRSYSRVSKFNTFVGSSLLEEVRDVTEVPPTQISHAEFLDELETHQDSHKQTLYGLSHRFALPLRGAFKSEPPEFQLRILADVFGHMEDLAPHMTRSQLAESVERLIRDVQSGDFEKPTINSYELARVAVYELLDECCSGSLDTFKYSQHILLNRTETAIAVQNIEGTAIR